MVSSSRRTSVERGILKVVLSIAKIIASYVGCTDLSSEMIARCQLTDKFLDLFKMIQNFEVRDKPSIDIWWFLNLVVYLI